MMLSILQTPQKIRQTLASIDPKLAKTFLPWIIRHPRYFLASSFTSGI